MVCIRNTHKLGLQKQYWCLLCIPQCSRAVMKLKARFPLQGCAVPGLWAGSSTRAARIPSQPSPGPGWLQGLRDGRASWKLAFQMACHIKIKKRNQARKHVRIDEVPDLLEWPMCVKNLCAILAPEKAIFILSVWLLLPWGRSFYTCQANHLIKCQTWKKVNSLFKHVKHNLSPT